MGIYASRYPAAPWKHAVTKICTYLLEWQRAPDHNTINRYRKNILTQEAGQDILRQLVVLLHKNGLLSFEAAFIDGTKIEANANKSLRKLTAVQLGVYPKICVNEQVGAKGK